MYKKAQLADLKELYKEGTNVMSSLRDGSLENHIEDITISYDLQAGSYTKSYYEDPSMTFNYCKSLVDYISKLDKIESVFEAGVGEGNKLVTFLNESVHNKYKFVGGADLSWSRIKYAQRFAQKELAKDLNIHFMVANIQNLPLFDDSIDLVYTIHALEPNGGKERELLCELYRVTKKYLVLIEPAYEFANELQRKRMYSHGYVKDLKKTAEELGYKIILFEKFPYCSNPMNPSEIMIIEKSNITDFNSNNPLCDPITKTALSVINDSYYYSKESLLAYPIMMGVPLLTKENAVVATKMEEFNC